MKSSFRYAAGSDCPLLIKTQQTGSRTEIFQPRIAFRSAETPATANYL